MKLGVSLLLPGSLYWPGVGELPAGWSLIKGGATGIVSH